MKCAGVYGGNLGGLGYGSRESEPASGADLQLALEAGRDAYGFAYPSRSELDLDPDPEPIPKPEPEPELEA